MSQTLYNDDLFDSRKYDKNQYSMFIQQLQQSTQKLMNEVFNTQYIPQINEQQIILDKLNKGKNKQSIYSLMTDERKKKIINDLSHSKKTAATKFSSQRQLSQSFVNFLKRNDKWKQRRLQRAKKQTNKKQQDQLKNLTFIPTILRGSIQKLQPIYQRGLDLHKNKQKKLTLKRIQKQRQQTEKQGKYTFQPQIINKTKNRTLQEYLKDKQQWTNKKQEYIQNSKIIRDAMKYQQCLFQPILVAKYNKNNPNMKKGQKVQDRLLRTLQKQIQKK